MKNFVVYRSDSPGDWVSVQAETAEQAAEIATSRWENIPPGTKISATEGKDPFHQAPVADAERATITVA